ncbi:hypothetical protein, partial [Undibacterium sp. GrIS 1.2]|uniref:hypothetical protein n=1 Tax=Undibacterium sp. GrIS 1.2 TaxID=3143933 RepID=UPI003390BC68
LGRGSCLLLNFETKECGAFISSLLDGCVGRLLLTRQKDQFSNIPSSITGIKLQQIAQKA